MHGADYNSIVNEHINSGLGYLIKSPFSKNKEILYGAMEHHEYYNGDGLPLGKKGKEISLFGRILSIVNEYDELVSGC